MIYALRKYCFLLSVITVLKGRVQCFSMQVVTNKYFLLNPEKMALIHIVVFEKNTHFNSEK